MQDILAGIFVVGFVLGGPSLLLLAALWYELRRF